MTTPTGHITAARREEFLARGYRGRTFFPHSAMVLPKCGPDGWKLARWMCGETDLDDVWEIVLHAAPELVEEFPREVFFDDDVVWHQQQFGRAGQVATANLVVRGRELYSMVHISDLVQRISRRRDLKSRVENRFKGWHHMLLNAVLGFAISHGLDHWHVPTSEWALRHTDPDRTVGPELFRRVYDRNVRELFHAEAAGPWWRIDVRRNADRHVLPETRWEEHGNEKTICICHDVEQGWGHRLEDPAFAAMADRDSERHLDRMLAVEREAGVRATYSVVGLLVPALRARIEADGHALAFHSYDHRISDPEGNDQLGRCRDVDYRLKGYRAPQSRVTPELTEENLCFHNFEWLASSAYRWGFHEPRLERRVAKIPIHFDDFGLYRGEMTWSEWEREALAALETRDFVAFGLHDCYGHLWLDGYPRFLDAVRRIAEPVTMNVAADRVFLAHAAAPAAFAGSAS